MENLLDLDVPKIQALGVEKMKIINGGCTNPTYYIKDNYDASVNRGAFFIGFIAGFLGF